jgi:hypothetical protein
MAGKHRYARRWRERAEQFFRLASEQTDLKTKSQMNVLAGQWEAMAAEAEQDDHKAVTREPD